MSSNFFAQNGYLFYTIYIGWLLSEILLNRLLRGSDTDKKQQDKGSLGLLWFVIIASTAAAWPVATFTHALIYPSVFINYTGLILVVIGIIIRFTAISQLGRLFTVMVTIREGHLIKKDGLYKYLRHPSYAGSLLSFFGYGLSINNWYSLIVAFVPVLLVFIYRMQVEEKVLLSQFNTEYEDYMKHTKRVIPFIY
ncbi:isoprenylcysteine carboxylmethyltransferase family protein [Chitinophaga silvatica]|uniref:Isoprenylcysteine carboxylmethyltransferase family protein n=1 Tax=Chitinophaga silvatica TaxID=2282649 RepID=A0A3E1Y4B2_9BACT|nr:isoprenylcysteine carboxylmethyltransferase family protein [Chitinophaga silvatica]RFS19525.1 isoprenylcysteine carboxylmethyltransferase family protein [Chitinophaga silvatica]